MISAFGVDRGEFSKAAYYAMPKLTGAKRAAGELLKAPKRPKKKVVHPEPDRKDYIAPDGVLVRWRGGGV